jgi:exodeoxyribonuclease VII large subunit
MSKLMSKMDKIYNPSDITKIIDSVVSQELINHSYKIKGELGNYSKRGGNIYATIKDKECSIDIISWSNPNDYQNGDEVIISGKINYYRKTNRLNLIAFNMEKKGMGDLFKKYIDFKDLYEKKGYFDKDLKKIEPKHINSIAIITSSEGAAIKDVLYVLKNDNFKGTIYLKDCMVQGVNAGKSVGNAIELINNLDNKIDMILVTRGGGSFEDLFQFSSSEVIEALHNSLIYTISAVGHETDNMLSDFVADYRAPTPSIGAQYISNIYNSKYDEIYEKGSFVRNKLKLMINKRKDKLQNIITKIKSFDIFDKVNQEFKNKQLLIKNNIKFKTYEIKNKIKQIKDKINYLEEKDKLLYNGYVMLVDPETEQNITDIDEIGYDFILMIRDKKYLIKPRSILEL